MALNLRPPSQGIGDTEAQLRNLYSYLFQMTEELNQAITSVENSGRDTLYKAVAGGGDAKKLPKSTAEAYQELKSLIIKTATDVTSSMRKIVTEMSAEYRAQSVFGTYEEFLNNKMTTSAEGILFDWNSENKITTNVAEFSEYKANSDVYMKIGIVGYNEDGTVEAGVVVGRDLQKVTIDGEEILISENVYSLLRADGLSLWQNGAKLTEVSLSGFFGEKAYIDEVTTDLIQSKTKGAQLALNEGLLEGLAENINLEANESIKLAVQDDLDELDAAIKLNQDNISLVVKGKDGTGKVELTDEVLDVVTNQIKVTAATELETEGGEVIINQDGVAMTGGQISMVTRKDGVVTGAVIINEDGIAAAGAKIELTAENGDEYINISSEGISASSMSAENVMPRYNGPNQLTVNASGTPSTSVFRSINSALSVLAGRYLPYDVTISVAAGHTEYGAVSLKGAVGGGWININGDSSNPAKIVGSLQLSYNTTPVSVSYVNVDAASGGTAINAQACMNLTVYKSKLTGTNGTGIGVQAQRNTAIYIGKSEIYGFAYTCEARDAGMLSIQECDFDAPLRAIRSTVYASDNYLHGHSNWDTSLWAGQVIAQGNTTETAAVTPPAVEAVPTTKTVAASGMDSWYSRSNRWYGDDDLIRQGYTEYNETWSGCVWFDMSEFKGKTIKSAGLTIKRVSSKGLGKPVVVKVYALTLAYSGHTSSNPNNYATYGQMIGEVDWGETVTLSLTGNLMSAIATTGVVGFMFRSDDTNLYSDKNYSRNYAIFESKKDNQEVLGLTVSYI